MVTLAYLGHRLSGQLSGNPEGLAGVDVVWQGARAEELLRSKPSDLSVLVAELEVLGEDPAQGLAHLRQRCRPELTLVLHHFAKREVLSTLLEGNTRTLQAPVSLSSLRSQMLSLIVRDMLSPAQVPPSSRSELPSTSPSTSPTTSRPTSPPVGPNICPQCGASILDAAPLSQ